MASFASTEMALVKLARLGNIFSNLFFSTTKKQLIEEDLGNLNRTWDGSEMVPVSDGSSGVVDHLRPLPGLRPHLHTAWEQRDRNQIN